MLKIKLVYFCAVALPAFPVTTATYFSYVHFENQYTLLLFVVSSHQLYFPCVNNRHCSRYHWFSILSAIDFSQFLHITWWRFHQSLTQHFSPWFSNLTQFPSHICQILLSIIFLPMLNYDVPKDHYTNAWIQLLFRPQMLKLLAISRTYSLLNSRSLSLHKQKRSMHCYP